MILDLRKLETMADFFVIATGEVDQQVRAIVKHIEDQVKLTLGERVTHREGTETMNWVLLDYIDVVVHVFKPSFREFYRLEDLWSDAEAETVSDEKKIVPRPKPTRRRLAEVKPATTRAATKTKEEKPKEAKPKKAAKPRVTKAPAAKAAPKAKPAKPKRKPASRVPKILEEPKPVRKRTPKPKA